jgi:hypothetical protein
MNPIELPGQLPSDPCSVTELCNIIEFCWQERDADARYVAELVLRGDPDRAVRFAESYAVWCARAETVRVVRIAASAELQRFYDTRAAGRAAQ